MGKSPGKWIKALIFGKKSSKSSSRKKSAMPEKDEAVSSKTPTFGCDNALCNANIGTGESSDKAKNVSLRNEIFPFSQPEEKQTATDQQELAAITAQAILRGYLARRRSFRAVKGIVRLQALVRGLLVRRQAVSTLRCAQGIVRLQALSRGGKVRASDIGREVQKKLGSRDISGFSTTPRQDKLSSNAFACKLLASSRTAIPLRFCYDPTVPNSAQQWLERWSSSKFWGPIPQSKKKKKDYTDKKTPRKKSNNLRIKKTDLTRLKQVEERVSNLTNNRKLLSELIREKHTTSPRNSEAKEPEKPSNELERVKQNLRRISASSKVALINSSHSQPLVETPKPVVPQKGDDKTEDKTDDNKPNEDIVAVERSDLSENVEKIIEDVSKIDETTQRSDLPRKLEFAENVSQRSPVVVPNYMTATKSAKAKLRGFGSPRSDRDEPDVSDGGLLRRHSLPYGKSSLMISPRPEKILATGENRPLLSSADGYVSGKATSRPGWRR